MSVAMGYFKEADFGPYEEIEGLNQDLEKGLELKDKLRREIESARDIDGMIFGSVRELRAFFQAYLGYFTSYERQNDLEVRLQFADAGQLPDSCGIVFLKLFSESLPNQYLGTLMVCYTSELELEWENDGPKPSSQKKG